MNWSDIDFEEGAETNSFDSWFTRQIESENFEDIALNLGQCERSQFSTIIRSFVELEQRNPCELGMDPGVSEALPLSRLVKAIGENYTPTSAKLLEEFGKRCRGNELIHRDIHNLQHLIPHYQARGDLYWVARCYMWLGRRYTDSSQNLDEVLPCGIES